MRFNFVYIHIYIYALSVKRAKATLSLCLNKNRAMKAYMGVEVYLHTFSTALDGGKLSASLPGRFTPPPGKETLAPEPV
jgi:hypothetical protein